MSEAPQNTDSKQCVHCGYSLAPDADFCTECGGKRFRPLEIELPETARSGGSRIYDVVIACVGLALVGGFVIWFAIFAYKVVRFFWNQ